MKLIRQLSLPVLLLLILILVITQITPPRFWREANIFHWLLFYLPVYLLISSLLNLYFKFWLKSGLLGLVISLLIVLLGLGQLGPVTGILIIGSIFFLLKYLKKPSPLERAIRSPRALKLKRQ